MIILNLPKRISSKQRMKFHRKKQPFAILRAGLHYIESTRRWIWKRGSLLTALFGSFNFSKLWCGVKVTNFSKRSASTSAKHSTENSMEERKPVARWKKKEFEQQQKSKLMTFVCNFQTIKILMQGPSEWYCPQIHQHRCNVFDKHLSSRDQDCTFIWIWMWICKKIVMKIKFWKFWVIKTLKQGTKRPNLRRPNLRKVTPGLNFGWYLDGRNQACKNREKK